MVRGTVDQMKLWNGYQWVDYDGTPQSGSVIAARTIEDGGSLDPAIKVITTEVSMDAVDAMHQRFVAMQDADTAEFVRPTRAVADERDAGERPGDELDKLPGELPQPRSTFTFDTSDEED